MKYKPVIIIQCIITYLMQLPFLGLIIALFINNEISDGIILGIELYCIIMCVLCFLIIFLNIVFALLNITKDVPCPYRTTMAIKIAMIPFYVINFLIWAIFIIGTLNPFFIIYLPFIIVLSIFLTYFTMISTSSHNIAYLLRQFFDKENLFNTKKLYYIIYIVCHFIFCVDVVASILLYSNHKPTDNFENVDV
jgi:hypothetical protein